MDDEVKLERYSPLMFQYKSEASPKMDSTYKFEQQILESPFITTEKIQEPMVSIYGEDAEAIHEISNKEDATAGANHPPTESSPIAVLPCSSTTFSSILLTSSAQTSSSSYQFLSLSEPSTTSSPSSLPSSTTETSLLPSSSTSASVSPSSIYCSMSSVCHSRPSSSSLHSSSPPSTSSSSPSSNSSASVHSLHHPILITELMPREVNVASLVSNGITLSRHSVDPSSDSASCEGDYPPSHSSTSSAFMDRKKEGGGRGGSASLVEPNNKDPGAISDVVTKILDDVDWSMIPTANKYVL